MEANTLNLPVLALRGLTVFPHTNLTFDVERRISIKALEVAMESGQEIFLVTQRELNTDAGHGCAACGRRSLICRAMWRWWRNPLP